MSRNSTKKQNGPLVINMNRDYDGCIYALPPKSQLRIQQAYPEAQSLPMVFLGYKDRSDFERLHAPLWNQMASMLTGLTPEQLSLLGGVCLYDYPGKSVIREWDPANSSPTESATDPIGSDTVESLSGSK